MDEIQKANLLADMKKYPCQYSREIMYEYISSGELTINDLVYDGNILTDSAYIHILRFPKLRDEQRPLPVVRSSTPYSEEGNLDVLLWGVPGVGRKMFLSGLLSLTGQLGFRFEPRVKSGAYACELCNYSRFSFVPPRFMESYIQVIDAQLNNESQDIARISFVEMPNEKLVELYERINNKKSTSVKPLCHKPHKGIKAVLNLLKRTHTNTNEIFFEDLGHGADGILNNQNRKIIFLFIEPENKVCADFYDKTTKEFRQVRNSDVIEKLIFFLDQHPSFLKKVEGIHIILTKCDYFGEHVDQNVILDKLNEQGYSAVLSRIKEICKKYDINKQTGSLVGLHPFCVGKFMPGDVYKFDETYSLMIFRVIQMYITTGGSYGPLSGFSEPRFKDFFAK